MSALTVDGHDPTPPYEQLRRQVVALVETGRLRPGDRLPPVRQVAGDLGLAAGTVARCYRELEAAGVVVTRRGGGTRIAESAAPVRRDSTVLDEYAAAYVARAAAIDATVEEMLAAVRRAHGAQDDNPCS